VSPEAKALVERAKTEAHKRGHAEVLPEHLVMALLGAPAGVTDLSRRAIDSRRLRAEMERRLEEVPARQAYRDSPSTPPLSSRFEELLRIAHRQRRLLHFLPYGDVSEATLITALLEERDIGESVKRSAFDVAPIVRLRENARNVARGYNHRNVLVDHALIALIMEGGPPALADALRVAGYDREKVLESLERRVRARGYVSQRLASPQQLVLFSIVKTIAAGGRVELSLDPIVIDFLRNEYLRKSLEAADVDPFALLYAYVHGRPPPNDARGGRAVFHDDDYSTQEFVVSVLKEAFGLDDDQAKKTMLAVHEAGSAVVADATAAAVARARAMAREKLMPLRVEVEE